MRETRTKRKNHDGGATQTPPLFSASFASHRLKIARIAALFARVV
jgi:hypothetical protein